MRTKEVIANLGTIAENLAVAIGTTVEEVRDKRMAAGHVIAYGDSGYSEDKEVLYRLGNRERRDHRYAPATENPYTPPRVGTLVRIAESNQYMFGERRMVAGQTKDIAATVIYDTTAKPVSPDQKTAMTALVPVLPWWRRRSARKAIANAETAVPAS